MIINDYRNYGISTMWHKTVIKIISYSNSNIEAQPWYIEWVNVNYRIHVILMFMNTYMHTVIVIWIL